VGSSRPRWVHIISVGTSLLANFERFKPKLAENLGVMGWSRAGPDDKVQELAMRRASRGDKVFNELLKFLSKDPEKHSAELNAFLRYVRLNSHVPPRDVGILLYSTDTGTCYLCASVIHEYLSSEGYMMLSPKPIRVEGLGKPEIVFDNALANLLDKVVTKIIDWSRKGVPVYINATGGFKAETQFLVIAASIAGARAAYYIHETFKDVVELPLPPLKIHEGLEKIIRKFKKAGPLNRGEFEELCYQAGLDPAELEHERKLIVNLKPRKWLLKLIRY